ncbi:cache domain-containing protein [Deltaproteobacteria bacterium TL4]
MKMIKIYLSLGLIIGIGWILPASLQAEASPHEVISLVNQAASFISKEAKTSLIELNKNPNRFMSKDLYVFVLDCEKQITVVQPIVPALVGKPISMLKDVKGNNFGAKFCELQNQLKGGWIEYWWRKPDVAQAFRKVSFVRKAEGSSYVVGAGIYEENLSIDELNALLK